MVTPRVFRLIGYRTGSVFSPEPSGPASEPVYVEDTTAVLGTEAAGASVRFSCWGRTHPPIYLGVDGDGLL